MAKTLLDVLRSTSVQTIKLLTSEKVFKKGHEDFLEQKVSSLAWVISNQQLKVVVRGATSATVMVIYEDADFRIECNCSLWNEDDLCRHAACTLFTLTQLLHDKRPNQTLYPMLSVLLGNDAQVLVSAPQSSEGLPLPQNEQAVYVSKPIKTVSLAINLDVVKKIGSDWFDIVPHMRFNGVLLTEEQQFLLLNHKDRFESVDSINILDAQSRDMIKDIIKLTRKNQEKAVSVPQIARLRMLELYSLRQKGVELALSAQDEELMKGLAQFSTIEPVALPKYFVGTLRDYQKSGYYWLAFLYKYRFGACLADDMGLGKTIQVIALLASIKEGIVSSTVSAKVPHLIMVPPTLIFNWQQELAHFYPDFKVKIYTGKAMDGLSEAYDILLTTYDRVRLDIDFFKVMMFDVVILDEAQAIKNRQAARTSAVRQLKRNFTICVTGTPLENHIGEYHSIIDMALPGLLPPYDSFMKLVSQGAHHEYIKKTKPFILRRTKQAILTELPDKVESNIILTMTDKQQKLYVMTVAQVRQMIDQAYAIKTGDQARVIALTALLRLRQICISPEIIDPLRSYESPKIDYLINNLGEIIQEGSAALVFSQFTTCLDLCEKALRKHNIPFYRIDGKTSLLKRKKIVEDFQNNNAQVSILLLSLKTGGVGLNLTRANYVFHLDPWWNPSVENQASDRAHRIGQQQTVFVSRLIMHQSIEEKMIILKERKRKLFDEVIEYAENKTSGLITQQDFDFLLT